MSKPIDRKVYAGSAAGAGAGLITPLLIHYLDMPGDVAAAWAALAVWISQTVAGYIARND